MRLVHAAVGQRQRTWLGCRHPTIIRRPIRRTRDRAEVDRVGTCRSAGRTPHPGETRRLRAAVRRADGPSCSPWATSFRCSSSSTSESWSLPSSTASPPSLSWSATSRSSRWIGVILILSGIGGVLWFIAGRPTPAERSAHDPHPGHPAGRGLRTNEPPDPIDMSRPSRTLAPDDDPDFLRSLSDQTRRADEERLRRWEADLRLREERLRQREDPPGDQV